MAPNQLLGLDSVATISRRLFRRLVSKSRNFVSRLVWPFRKNRIVVIHVPKCAGRTLNVLLKRNKNLNPNVRWLGHLPRSQAPNYSFLPFVSRPRVVALTRNPADWYRSRLRFVRQQINLNGTVSGLNSRRNLYAHLTNFGTCSFEQFVLNVANPNFVRLDLEPIIDPSRVPLPVNETLTWLKSTRRGLYTFTLIYYLWDKDVYSLSSAIEVDEAMSWIANNTSFVRSEQVSEDAGRLFNLTDFDVDDVGKSSAYALKSDEYTPRSIEVIGALDSLAATLSGGYRLASRS